MWGSRKIKKERAPMIALFGPDGSGKTTVAELSVKRWEEIGIQSIRMHWRPGVLPYRKFRYHENLNKFTNPHANKIRGGIKGLLIFFYIAIDFIVGYYFLVRPHIRHGVVVIYERYYYDIIIDQKRYGLRVPLSLRKFVTSFLPFPDIIIQLDAPSDILQARKGEIESTEIERQRLIMKRYLSRFDGFHIVDVGSSLPNEVTDLIFQIAKQ